MMKRELIVVAIFSLFISWAVIFGMHLADNSKAMEKCVLDGKRAEDCQYMLSKYRE